MKYSEFKTKMKELELNVDLIDSNDEYMSVQYNGIKVATVSKKHILVIGIDYQTWKELEVWERKILFDYLVALSKTPIKERDDEKKYNVIAYETYEGPKGGRLHKMFYYRNSDYTLGAMIESRNDDENQQWTLQQIREWGIEDCERIEVKN